MDSLRAGVDVKMIVGGGTAEAEVEVVNDETEEMAEESEAGPSFAFLIGRGCGLDGPGALADEVSTGVFFATSTGG